MSNEMISVPRELLERALRELLDWEAADEFASVKRTHDELRALLAKPAKPPLNPNARTASATQCLGAQSASLTTWDSTRATP